MLFTVEHLQFQHSLVLSIFAPRCSCSFWAQEKHYAKVYNSFPSQNSTHFFARILIFWELEIVFCWSLRGVGTRRKKRTCWTIELKTVHANAGMHLTFIVVITIFFIISSFDEKKKRGRNYWSELKGRWDCEKIRWWHVMPACIQLANGKLLNSLLDQRSPSGSHLLYNIWWQPFSCIFYSEKIGCFVLCRVGALGYGWWINLMVATFRVINCWDSWKVETVILKIRMMR